MLKKKLPSSDTALNINEIGIELFKNSQFIAQFQKNVKSLIQINKNQQILTPKTATSQFKFNEISKIQQLQDIDDENRYRLKQYPWIKSQNIYDQPTIQVKQITNDIVQVIQQTIQNSLHHILNKQFINVTNQILVMRQQMSAFTKQSLQQAELFKTYVQRQIQQMKKKITQQQHISNSIFTPTDRFSRSKPLLNSNNLGNSNKQSQNIPYEQIDTKKSIHHQIYELKKQIESLKRKQESTSKASQKQSLKFLDEKCSLIEDKLSQQMMDLKIKLEQTKISSKKAHQALLSQFRRCDSRQFIKQQLKRSLKSSLKVYLDQITKTKKDIQKLFNDIQLLDKGLQQYIGNQLKNVWTLVHGVKQRIQNLEGHCQISLNQSFIL